VSIDRMGNVLPEPAEQRHWNGNRVPIRGVVTQADSSDGSPFDPDAEAVEFVRFCYRRRAVGWPELYDEMCAVAARGDYRGMEYEQLQGLGIGFALSSLPRLAELAARVIAQERGRQPIAAVA
jgi:hypothetical protein